MKLRLSLRLYFLAGVLFLMTALVAGFSVVSVNNFLDGMDAVMRGTMQDMANSVDVEDGRVHELLDVKVSRRWQDMPTDLTQHFDGPPEQFGVLKKFVRQENWFTRPTEGHLAMKVKRSDGQIRYLVKSFGPAPKEDEHRSIWHNRIVQALVFGLLCIAVCWALLLLLLKHIASPIERLRQWARELSPERLANPAPDFRYSELNALAELIRQSLSSVQEGLAREQDFLRHASHELRTPIAVVRSNTELLNKLLPDATSKQQAVIQRITNAGVTMSDLTETLLWLSREHESAPATREVRLDQLLEQLAEDLRYLIKGKRLALHMDCHVATVTVSETACRIVLNNLIRNAFQHTQSGWVNIQQMGNRVLITNHDDESSEAEQQELGFGLGLALTEKLTRRLGWKYTNQPGSSGHSVEVILPNASPTALG